jgi:hypothetical protein
VTTAAGSAKRMIRAQHQSIICRFVGIQVKYFSLACSVISLSLKFCDHFVTGLLKILNTTLENNVKNRNLKITLWSDIIYFFLSFRLSFCSLFFAVFAPEQLPNPCAAGSNPAGGTNKLNVLRCAISRAFVHIVILSPLFPGLQALTNH